MAKQLHHLEIHPAKNGGHTIQHHFLPEKSKTGAVTTYSDPEQHVFGHDEHGAMLGHVSKALGLKVKDMDEDGE